MSFTADINYGVERYFIHCRKKNDNLNYYDDEDGKEYYDNKEKLETAHIEYNNSENFCYSNSNYFDGYIEILFKLSVSGDCSRNGGHITWVFRK